MRWAALAMVAVLALAGCSRHKPPVGKWEGGYDSSDTIIAAWLEIGKDGQVRVSAPDTLNIAPDTTEEQRQELRDEMVARLASGWGSVEQMLEGRDYLVERAREAGIDVDQA